MASAPGVPIEHLLAQREWVRALARTLVRDEAAADDLEQQVWLESLESPPARASALRGWFTTLLRRRARDAWRSSGRRRRREEAAARPEGARSAADLVAEAEAQQRVVHALLALEEPYREAVLLRFYEDLPPSAIALRLGVSRETVKTRLRRAMDLLRERLAAGRPDGKEWRLALLPLTGFPGAAGGAAMDRAAEASPGRILVKLSTRAAIAAGALAVTGLSLWLTASPTREPTAAGGPTGVPVASVAEPPPAEEASAAVPAAPAAPAVPGTPSGVAPIPLSGLARDRLPFVVAVAESPRGMDRVDVEVDAKGRVRVDGREVTMKALVALLKEKADSSREEEEPRCSRVNAVLRVDRDLPWQGAQWVMQACGDPVVRVPRIHFAAVPDSGGEEGVLPTFLPTADESGPAEGDLVEEGAETTAEGGRRTPVRDPVIAVRLERTGSGTAVAPRDLHPYLERRFPDLRRTGFEGRIDATPSVPVGDVLAVVDAMRRAGVRRVLFKGTRVLRGDSVEEALAALPPAEGTLEISVLGESIAAR